jgi:protein-arginine kinase activator protein McsA
LHVNDEEKLVGELAKLQTLMMILEDKEEYEQAATIKKKIEIINKKLNDGTGKY